MIANGSPSAKRRVGVIQSAYIPWRGYFDFINSVDIFVIYDDVQYSKNSWRNRNRVKTELGLKWITVPVRAHISLAIKQVELARLQKDWRDAHRRILTEALSRAPFFKEAIALWEAGVCPGDTMLSILNIRLIKLICEYLGITTPILNSADFGLSGAKTARLLQLLKKLDATTYLTGPSARGYLDENMIRENGIRLEYKAYDYEPYPQLWGEFAGSVSVLDLIANTGSASRHDMRSNTPDEVIVE